MCKGCFLLITSYCMSCPLKFTPATQVVLHTLEVRVQTPLTHQLSWINHFPFPSLSFFFGGWTPQVIKNKSEWPCQGIQCREETILYTSRVQGRFWRFQPVLALSSLNPIGEQSRRRDAAHCPHQGLVTSSIQHLNAAPSIWPFSNSMALSATGNVLVASLALLAGFCWEDGVQIRTLLMNKWLS